MSEWTDAQEDRFADPEELVDAEALKNPIQRERIDVAVKLVGGPGLKVLDVGVSGGGISELIHNNGNECWGMDLPRVVARVPEERLKWLHATAGDASQKPWPFESESMNCVFMGEIIEHFIDLEPPLTEAWRVLKPDGRLVITTPNVARALNRVVMLFGQVHTFHEANHIPHHVRFFTPSTLSESVRRFGFIPTRMGSGRSQAEGSDLGFNPSILEPLTPSERAAILHIIDRFCPEPVWRHSFIILESAKSMESQRDDKP